MSGEAFTLAVGTAVYEYARIRELFTDRGVVGMPIVFFGCFHPPHGSCLK